MSNRHRLQFACHSRNVVCHPPGKGLLTRQANSLHCYLSVRLSVCLSHASSAAVLVFNLILSSQSRIDHY